MEWIYRLKLIDNLTDVNNWKENDELIVRRHFNHLLHLKEKDVLLLAGKTKGNDKDTIGIVIFKAPSYKEALKIMNNDPAIKEGIMTGFLQEYSTAVFNTSYKKD